MRTLTIEARSLESACGFVGALSAFDAKLIQEVDGYFVEVAIRGSNRRIMDVLNALEAYVTRREGGAAVVDLDGRRYTMHPAAA